jgi:ADP-ribose pyrophosphatase YjhB (NUDIX family)
MSRRYLPDTPKLSVDAIIHIHDKIVLIERKNPPLGYAFPGGFVDVGESCEEAVVREAKEEVCLDCKVQGVLGVYSEPDRDKRGHIVSIAYILTAPKGSIPRAADDAKEAFLTTPHYACKKVLVVDHKQMLLDFYHKYWDKWQGNTRE